MPKAHGIEGVETISGQNRVIITLRNGITLEVFAKKGFIHLNFLDGLPEDRNIVCTPYYDLGESPKNELECSTFVNVFYPRPNRGEIDGEKLA